MSVPSKSSRRSSPEPVGPEWTLVHSAYPQALCLLDRAGSFRAVNAAARQLFGFGASELSGHQILGFAHSEDRPIVLGALGDAADDGTAVVRARVETFDGRLRWIEWTFTPAAGGTPGILAWGRDITEQRAVMEELRHTGTLLQARLEERTRALARAMTLLEDERRERREMDVQPVPGMDRGMGPREDGRPPRTDTLPVTRRRREFAPV